MIVLLVQLAIFFGLLSAIAVGGAFTLLPFVHGVVVRRGWLDDVAFAQVVALSQVAPGPNMMYIPLIGWIVAGPLGAVVASVAFILPPAALAVVVGRALQRHGERPAVAALRRALRPVAAGVLAGAGIVLGLTFARARWFDVVIVLAVAILATRTKYNVLWWIGLSALAGTAAAL
jgi:chromate transporter